MPKRVHRKSKRMSKRGGYIGEGVVNSIGSYVIAPVTGAAEAVVGKPKQDGEGTGSWLGSWFTDPVVASPAVAVVPPAPVPTAPGVVPVAPVAPTPVVLGVTGGSRRRKRSGRKSKNMFSGLMKMVGFKTKKRGRRGGIGGPPQGYQYIVGANFPSAAGPDGNNIYNLAPFDPSKPFSGGMKGGMKGGCMPSKSIPLSPAPFPSSGMLGGKSKHRRKRSGGKSKKHGW